MTDETTDSVRREVADLVRSWLDEGRFEPSCDAWLRHYDLEFSQALGARGLLGITWPKDVGGGGLSGAARLVVTEELLRHGAPVAAHWIADRQIGPSILRHGTEAAKARYLPGIAAGEITFCLGMSEPGSGSDLASVATRAVRVDGGWEITGQKIWTSQGHRSTHAYVLARTGTGESKHDGLSEFIVDMADPGVTVRPIVDLRGEHHFNEMFFDAVRVDDDHVIGEIGNGWDQVTAQLSLERGGIERVLSTYPLLSATLEELRRRGDVDAGDARIVGETMARLATLRAMVRDITIAIDEGGSPVVEAAMLKDLGTTLEGQINEVARLLLGTETDPDAPGAARLLAQGVQAAPGFTIRGGTTEVLRSIVARSTRAARPAGDDLAAIVADVLDGHGGEAGGDVEATWRTVTDLGWHAVGVEEDRGGEGGTLGDVVTIVTGLARANVSLPVAETVLAGRALARAGLDLPGGTSISTIALPGRGDPLRLDADGRLTGSIHRVPWGRQAERVVTTATRADGGVVLVVVPGRGAGVAWHEGRNLAGEPRDDLDVRGVRAEVLDGVDAVMLEAEAGLLRAAAMHGALDRALQHTIEHVRTREQFGRPLIAFQAVGGLLAVLASEVESARIAVGSAERALTTGSTAAWLRVAAARVVAGRAATEGTRIAHELHAAMGVTREHPLHLSTRRAWSWRDELGTQRSWTEGLGRRLLAVSDDDVWAWLTGHDA
ncbi:MAG: acyl-CoA dehydrogenase protein [Aeromicrobium sp.]|jgi:alkylation response protein AidB-like acyl-CoA dehydrogenase|nr:acyl-CoA dehydrogenase protein [Aeromicrobium sp.]